MRIAIVLALSLTGCAVDEVVVATIATDAGVDSATGGCKTNDDCDSTELCARTDCNQPTGVCQVRPILCIPPDPAPVCGCDGVTYWNDCLRLRNGATASRPGQCTTNAAKCEDPGATACPLPSGVASCARFLPPGGMCRPDVRGVCWVLPAMCPMPAPPERWDSCGPGPMCVNTCDAIRSGIPHRPPPPGTCM